MGFTPAALIWLFPRCSVVIFYFQKKTKRVENEDRHRELTVKENTLEF